MAGTKNGGKLAAATNKSRYGADFYARIGANGGAKSRTGGFASNKRGEDGLTGAERARIAGARGGQISRRKKVVAPTTSAQADDTTATQKDLAA